MSVKGDYQYVKKITLKRNEVWLAWRDYKVKITINVKYNNHGDEYISDSSLYFYTSTSGFWPPSIKNFKVKYKNDAGEWKYYGWCDGYYIEHHDDNERTISSTFPTATDTWSSVKSLYTNHFYWKCTWNFNYGSDTGTKTYHFVA